jgi:thymidine kinase
MFSGKSTELIREIRLAKVIEKKVLVIKPLLDDRYENTKIVSHSFESEECNTIDFLYKLDEQVLKYDLIVIDEGQFFPDLKETVLKWVEQYNKEILIGGLDGDFKRKPIGQILELIPYADKCKKISSMCKLCNDGTKAIFSHRITNNNEQVQIGGSESYSPLCRKHYILMNELYM